MYALAVLALLVAVRNPGVWAYLLRTPSVIDGRSASIWLAYGLWPVLLAGGAWLSGLGLGRRLMGALAAPQRDALDGIMAAALGLGLTAQAVFLFGWAGGLTPLPLAALAAAAAAAGWTAAPRPPRTRAPMKLGAPVALAAGLLAFVAFHLLVVALAPPTEWDARAYHLALPELYLRSGRLAETPWLLHSHWPHLMEALYALPLAAGRDGAAALLHAGACALLVAGVFLASGGGAAGWCAALILAGQPALLRGAPTATSDGACALFLFAAAAALARWESERTDGRLAVAGLLAGLATAAKLFGGAGPAAWTLYLAWRTRRPREAALFAACAAAVACPWLLRTWLNTGDPVWPLLGLDRAAHELAARCVRVNFWVWPPPSWLWTHRGPAFLLVPLAGLAALGRGGRPAPPLERILWLAAPLILAPTLRNNDLWRVLLPVYAAAALSCGRFAAAAFSAGGTRRAAAAALVAFGAAPIAGLAQNNELFAVLGLRSAAVPGAQPRALYEDRSVDVSSFYREAAAALAPGSKVLLFREVRGYGAGFEYMWGDPVNQSVIEYRRLPNFDALYARLKELGVTHVLDHEGSHLYGEDPLYYDARTLNMMSGMLKRRARPRLVREGLVLYQLL